MEVNSFYNYLIANGYYFDKELIENYLLSLKVKPFEILTGNSGTGKTKLSQLFAQYVGGIVNPDFTINQKEHSDDSCYHGIKVSTGARSWGFKKKDNTTGHQCGWSLSPEYFTDVLPVNSILGTYEIEIDGYTKDADIEFVPQLYYDKKNKELIEYFKGLYEKEEEQIKIDKKNDVRHKKQLVDLGIGCKDLYSVVSDDYDQQEDIIINMTISSFIARNRVVLSWDIFDYVPFKKSISCNIIASGIRATATFYPKFRLFNHLSDEIVEHLEKLIEINKEQWFSENKTKIESWDEDKTDKEWKKFKKDISFKLKIKNFKPKIGDFTPVWNKVDIPSKNNLNDYFALKQSSENKYCIVPIGANWTDNTNIVGYHNVITGDYQSTPAYELIKRAQKDPNNPYFLILDEMNLSHVERYFADFLSAIESGEEIPLYGEDKTLTLPKNLFIIGTVNVDETTYMFSPKVLDRANTIEFDTVTAWDYMISNLGGDDFEGNIEYLQSPLIDSDISKLNIQDLKGIFSEISYNDDNLWDTLAMELTIFQETLKGSSFDFGFRVINEILRFMVVAWRYENSPDEWNNWERYFDAQIKQKILPKLHGSEKAIGNVLTNLFNLCLEERNNNENPKNCDINKANCRYYTSAVKLQNMSKVLSDQRYVSFIN